MKTFTHYPKPPLYIPRKHQEGYVLVVSLIILLVLSLIVAVSIHSARNQTVMGGNTREKARALHAAQSAMTFAEGLLVQGTMVPESCAQNTGKMGSAKICKESVKIINSEVPPLETWVEYVPSTDSTEWEVDESGKKGAFYHNPGFYIQYLENISNADQYYQITAFGYGGNAQAVAITQNLFMVKPAGGNNTQDLGD